MKLPIDLKSGIADIIDKATTGASEVIKDFKADPNKVLDTDLAMAKIKADAQSQFDTLESQTEINAQNNLTERDRIDMASDSRLSKNLRPGVCVFACVSVLILCILDSSHAITVSPAWVNVFQGLLETVTAFYFVGRTTEKIVQMKNN